MYILLGAEISKYTMKTENNLNHALRICLSGMGMFIQSSSGAKCSSAQFVVWKKMLGEISSMSVALDQERVNSGYTQTEWLRFTKNLGGVSASRSKLGIIKCGSCCNLVTCSLLWELECEMLSSAAVICFDFLPVFCLKIEGSVAEIWSPSMTVTSTWICNKWLKKQLESNSWKDFPMLINVSCFN